MAFHIVRNDITRMNVDAIVNSANPEPTYAYGTDFAVYRAAGAEQMLCERKQIGTIVPGNAIATSAGNLNAQYVIHTVAPLWENGEQSELTILRNCYQNSLELARKLHCKSIAFPLLATGVYGFPKDQALEVAMSSIQAFLLHHSMDVFLVVFDEKSFVLSGHVFEKIQSSIDMNYVAEVAGEEYQCPENNINEDDLSEDEKTRQETLKGLARYGNRQRLLLGTKLPKGEETLDGLYSEQLSLQTERTFQEQLFIYIDRSGKKPSSIYRPIEMSRQQYSRMQCNRNYQPKKTTAMLLAIILQLSIEETEDLLSRAGYAFNPCSKQDLIVKACLIHGQYDLYIIDAMMQNNNLDTLIDYEGKRS